MEHVLKLATVLGVQVSYKKNVFLPLKIYNNIRLGKVIPWSTGNFSNVGEVGTFNILTKFNCRTRQHISQKSIPSTFFIYYLHFRSFSPYPSFGFFNQFRFGCYQIFAPVNPWFQLWTLISAQLNNFQF